MNRVFTELVQHLRDAGDAEANRQDLQSALNNPVASYDAEINALAHAAERRYTCGNIFLLLRLLQHVLDFDSILEEFPDLFTYVGFDCSIRWHCLLVS